jgi:hypothetical protein
LFITLSGSNSEGDEYAELSFGGMNLTIYSTEVVERLLAGAIRNSGRERFMPGF